MKVILTGATGRVGGEILDQLLLHPDVSAVTALARRELAITHAKLTTRSHRDFSTYGDELVASLEDHHACIWALGGKASDFDSRAKYEQMTYGFTLALANALATSTSRLTFCYLSGMGADPSESVLLPWEKDTRTFKGRAEKELAALAKEHPRFSAVSFRPGGILSRQGQLWAEFFFRPWVVRVNVLAAAMIDVALHGSPEGTVLNRAIRTCSVR